MNTAALIILLVLLALAAFFAYQLLNPPPISPRTPPAAPPQESTSQPPPNNSTADGEIPPPPPQSDAQWELITNQNVESACLEQSRREAQSQGYPPGVVRDCACSGQQTQDTKNYECTISALDGSHAGSVSCSRISRTCTISSEFGTYTYTFDELQGMAG